MNYKINYSFIGGSNTDFSPLLTENEINNIKKGQTKLIKMLELFNKICRNNNIKYCIWDGSLLGHVRHNKKFIPYDCDIDICMLKDDYEKFVTLDFDKILPKHIYFQMSVLAKRYISDTSKLNEKYIDHLYDSEITKLCDISAHHYISDKFNKSKFTDIDNKNYIQGLSLDLCVCRIEDNNQDGNKYIKTDYYQKHTFNYSDIYPLKEEYFENVLVYVPNKPHKILEIVYGKNWKFPVSRENRFPHEGLIDPNNPLPLNLKLRPDLYT